MDKIALSFFIRMGVWPAFAYDFLIRGFKTKEVVINGLEGTR